MEGLHCFHRPQMSDLTFKELKTYLMSPSVLSQPYPKEDLYMYLALSDHAISLVLLRQNDGVQRPMYYSIDSKTMYLLLEKVVLALVHTARKLLHYF